jgi:ribonuclease HI
MYYYAVQKGYHTGVFKSWALCEKEVTGYTGAVFKKFKSLDDATAFVNQLSKPKKKPLFVETYTNPIDNPELCNPDLGKPDLGKPDLGKPELGKPELGKPDLGKPELGKPKLGKPDLGKPELGKPELGKPDLGKPDLGKPDLGKPKLGKPRLSKQLKQEQDYYVYTDGSCIGNGSKNAKAGIGIYFGPNDPRNISKLLTHPKKTNNTAELTALLEAFTIIEPDLKNNKKITIYTDSTYSIKCLSGYGKKQELSNWSNDIPNKVLVKTLYTSYKPYLGSTLLVKHIEAHTGLSDIHSLGNEQADLLASLSYKKVY